MTELEFDIEAARIRAEAKALMADRPGERREVEKGDTGKVPPHVKNSDSGTVAIKPCDAGAARNRAGRR